MGFGVPGNHKAKALGHEAAGPCSLPIVQDEAALAASMRMSACVLKHVYKNSSQK